MRPDTLAYCVLGSNQGPRAEMLRRAVFLLADTPRVELRAASRLWETPPWGLTDQEMFLNAAVSFHTTLEPEALLDRFQEIERQLGRAPESTRQQWGPRPIDLDIALMGERVVKTDRLEVPHPRLDERAFALAPLLDIAPDLCSPLDGHAYADALERLDDTERQNCRPGPPLLENAADVSGALGKRLSETESVLLSSRSPEETQTMAATLGASLEGGEVFALAGNLGAGKTCFARGLARGLGINEPVTSPSYVLVKSYEGARLTLHHADFYRLAGDGGAQGEMSDLASLGLEDYLEDAGAVLLIEWADRRPGWLEPPFWSVEITGAGAAPRTLLLRRV